MDHMILVVILNFFTEYREGTGSNTELLVHFLPWEEIFLPTKNKENEHSANILNL